MSEIHFEFIPLEDLIKLSDAILIVKKKEPYEQIEEIPLLKEQPDKYPHHKRVTYRFTILSILYAADAIITDIDVIVHLANDDAYFELYRLYYVEGIDESPDLIGFDTDLDLYSADEFIIFVNKIPDTTGEYKFTVENAFLLTEEKEKVEELLVTIEIS